MVKPTKYEPIQSGEISVDSALIQAAIALDAAGGIAQERKDADLLLRVADKWLAVCDGLSGSKPKEEDSPKPNGMMGFSITQQDKLGEAAKDDNNHS